MRFGSLNVGIGDVCDENIAKTPGQTSRMNAASCSCVVDFVECCAVLRVEVVDALEEAVGDLRAPSAVGRPELVVAGIDGLRHIEGGNGMRSET